MEVSRYKQLSCLIVDGGGGGDLFNNLWGWRGTWRRDGCKQLNCLIVGGDGEGDGGGGEASVTIEFV